MTHDDLLLFAAKKLGISLEWRDGTTPVYSMGLFTLTSPDLFLKGLAVAYRELSTVIYTDDILMQKGEREVIKPFMQVEDIPLTFWQCWAEVEGK